MNRPTLSVLVCVKNEELLLGQTLACMATVAHEMLVVDTGSNDATVDIARQAGARVLHGPQGKLHLQAWNMGLQEARGDWLLNLDGDEAIAASDLPELRRLLYSRQADAYTFPVRNYTTALDLMWNWHPNDGRYPQEETLSGCPGWWKSQALRLFRRLPGVRFREGDTNHTRPDDSIHGLGLKVAEADIFLHNLGWLKGGDAYLAHKNAARLEGELLYPHKQPGDHVNIARTCLFLGRDGQALEHLEQALAMDAGFVDAYYIRALVGKESGQLDLAEHSALQALALQADHADAWTVLGMVYEMLGRPQESEGALRKALHIRDSHPLASNSLGIALEAQDRVAEAEVAYRRALQVHPGHPYALENLGSLCESQQRYAEAADLYQRSLQAHLTERPDLQQRIQHLRSLTP